MSEKKKSKKKSFKSLKTNLQGWGFIAPALVIVLIFVVISIGFSVYLSFHKVSLIKKTYDFIGFTNYKRLFTDTKTKVALMNTLKFSAVVVPIQTALALIMAAVLNAKLRGKMLFRTIYFLPTLTSSAALTMLFMFVFSLSGPLNTVLTDMSILEKPINFLNDSDFTLSVIMVMNIWSTVPFFMIVYLSSLQDIPKSLYEAADVDGATAVQKFFKITVPHVSPVTTFVVLMGIIGTLQMFDQAFIFSNGSGGPENSTLTVALLIYRYAFGQGNTMGYASAIAIILSILIFTISMISRKVMNSDNPIY